MSRIIESVAKSLAEDPTRRIFVCSKTAEAAREALELIRIALVARSVVVDRMTFDDLWVAGAGPDPSVHVDTVGASTVGRRFDEAVGYRIFDDVWDTPWSKTAVMPRFSSKGRGLLR